MPQARLRILDVTSSPGFVPPKMLPVFDEDQQLIGDVTRLYVEESDGRRYLAGIVNVTRMPSCELLWENFF